MINRSIGINFQGYGSAMYQNRPTSAPPQDYVEDSFQIFSENNISLVRIPYYWESCEANKSDFYGDLAKISKVADAYDIECIYDSHQWECSSWLGFGIGIPNSLLSSVYEKNNTGSPNRSIIKDFWNRWWNRKIITKDNIDGWEAQMNFIKEVISYLENKKSTFGFEILNEPQVYCISDYNKIGLYHKYTIKELRKTTSKPLFFNAAISHTIDNPLSQSALAPDKNDNIIYDVHMYPPSYYNMQFFKFTSYLMRIAQIYVGEFNSGCVYRTGLSREDLTRYLRLFSRSKIFGWAVWRWYYVTDINIPAFNFATIKNGKINQNSNFINLSHAIREIYCE
jgi:Cellulase (glycosyl hydrolase family 5)